MRRAQISTEYMIILSFVTFLVMTILGVALFYSSEIKDTIKFSQLESLSSKIISTSESIHYAGEPSRATITGYIPAGVTEIEILNKDLTFTVSTSSGMTKISYTSSVILEGDISNSNGLKKIKLTALPDKVVVEEG